MAIRPDISLAIQNPDIGNLFSNALATAQQAQQLGQSREQAPLQNELLQAQVGQQQQAQQQSTQMNNLRSIAKFGLDLLGNTSLESIRAKTVQRINDVNQRGGTPTDSQELLARVIDNPDLTEGQKVAQVQALAQDAIATAQRFGVIQPEGGGLTAGQRDRQSLLQDLSSEDESVARSAEIALRLAPPAAGSAAQTIAALGTAGDVAESQAVIAGRTEEAKLTEQLKFKPQITKAVKLAEREASARGETLTDLKRAQAAMPGLRDTVSQLKELATLATSTFGGRVFDAAVRESGFGATEGGTARAKYTAIVSNQILPLLRETFGSAFTASEGERLIAVLGDINLSPDERIAQLDSFIDQKVKNIETKEREVLVGQPPVPQPQPQASPQQPAPQAGGGIQFLGFE